MGCTKVVVELLVEMHWPQPAGQAAASSLRDTANRESAVDAACAARAPVSVARRRQAHGVLQALFHSRNEVARARS